MTECQRQSKNKSWINKREYRKKEGNKDNDTCEDKYRWNNCVKPREQKKPCKGMA